MNMNTLLARSLARTNIDITRVTANWYWFVITGIVFLMGGFLAITKPVMMSFAIETLIAWSFITGGILQTLQLLRASQSSSFIWSILLGSLLIVLGMILVKNPMAGLLSLTLLVGLLLVTLGLTKLIYALKLYSLNGWFWLVISGLISLALAFLLMSNLATHAQLTLHTLLTIELISNGLWLLLLGSSFKKLYHDLHA